MRRAAVRVLGILVLLAALTFVASETGSSVTPFSFAAAIAISAAAASVVTYLAGRAYLRRGRQFRFGLPVTAILFALVWLAVAFVLFDRFYNGY